MKTTEYSEMGRSVRHSEKKHPLCVFLQYLRELQFLPLLRSGIFVLFSFHVNGILFGGSDVVSKLKFLLLFFDSDSTCFGKSKTFEPGYVNVPKMGLKFWTVLFLEKCKRLPYNKFETYRN